MTLGMRRLAAALALLSLVVLWAFPEHAAEWFHFALAIFGART